MGNHQVIFASATEAIVAAILGPLLGTEVKNLGAHFVGFGQ